MLLRRLQFTIGSLMIGVLLVGVLLTLFRVENVLVFIIPVVVLFPLVAVLAWQMVRHQRGWAEWCFWSSAITVNVVVAALCAFFWNMGAMAVIFGLSYFGIPMILGFGAARAGLVSHCKATSNRWEFFPWAIVLVMGFASPTMILTNWPLRLAFLVSRPAFDRLADRVASGMVLRQPEWAGLYLVVGSAVDPATGNVGLVINPDPSGRSGFLRLGKDVTPEHRQGPFYNFNTDLRMNTRWWYQDED